MVIDGVVSAAEENRGAANGAVEPEEKYSTMNLLRMMEAASASPEAWKSWVRHKMLLVY